MNEIAFFENCVSKRETNNIKKFTSPIEVQANIDFQLKLMNATAGERIAKAKAECEQRRKIKLEKLKNEKTKAERSRNTQEPIHPTNIDLHSSSGAVE